MTSPGAEPGGRPGAAGATAAVRSRTAWPPEVYAYGVLVGLLAVVACVAAWQLDPLDLEQVRGLLLLLALGWASARLRDSSVDSHVDLSFTGIVVLAAIPIVGPFGAAGLGVSISFLDGRRGPALVRLFNAAMNALAVAAAGLVYLWLGGLRDLRPLAAPADYLLRIGIPLLGADVVLCLLNGLVLAGMISVTARGGRAFLAGPFRRTLPLYLGYALTGFVFVVLWGPRGLSLAAGILIIAPLVVARWSYAQYGDHMRSRLRVVETLAAAGHIRDGAAARVARIERLGRLVQHPLRLSTRERAVLRYAAALHDIGIVAIPHDLLARPADSLDADELRAVAGHAEAGADVLEDVDALRDVALVVRHHHERVDGRGYPDGLAGRDIPRVARVLAAADVYEAAAWPDAMTGPGRHERALAVLRSRAGIQLDADVVEAMAATVADERVRHELDEAEGNEPAPAPGGRLGHASAQMSDLIAADGSVRRGRPGPRRRVGFGLAALWPSLGVGATVAVLTALAVYVHRFAGSPADEMQRTTWAVLLVYLVAIFVAEQFRLRSPGGLETAPVAAAAGIAVALTTDLPVTGHLDLRSWQVTGVVALAQVLDWAVVRHRVAAGRRMSVFLDGAIRLAAIGVVTFVYRDVAIAGRPLAQWLVGVEGYVAAAVLAPVVLAVLLLEVPVRARRRAAVHGSHVVSMLPEELRSGVGLAASMSATGVVVALSQDVLGLASLPLLLLPLAISQLAVRREHLTRLTYRQIIGALSRMPEIAGLVPPGHAERVAERAVRVAREMGMPEREVVDLEYAALLHDIGQLALRRPIPGGATVLAATGDQQRIAENGAAIVRRTGTLDRAAELLLGQAVPYHHVVEGRLELPLGSRIIKVANAFEDHRAHGELPADSPAAAHAALERLYLGLGHEYDPRAVRALERVLLPPPERPAGVDLGARPLVSGAGLRRGRRVSL